VGRLNPPDIRSDARIEKREGGMKFEILTSLGLTIRTSETQSSPERTILEKVF
jgi:hypothetical protein